MLQRTQILNRTQFRVHAAYKYMIFCLGLDRRYLNVNVWMWRHAHTLEANLKRSVLRFVFNLWLSSWLHDVILHRNLTWKPTSTWESKSPYINEIIYI